MYYGKELCECGFTLSALLYPAFLFIVKWDDTLSI